ncbi:MAG TPA: type IV pilus modification protein PilV [Rhodanobacteraceae bacterium]|nr:type IV pilus modification protein PilV [Rhodanobacteraceae bacterium]
MRKNISGFSLLEVLIAVVVVSLGMLGVGAALVTVHRTTASSYLQQQSAQLASDIIERMRQNVSGAQLGDYDIAYTGGAVTAPAVMCDPTGAACTAAQQAAYDLWQWLNGMNTLLPGASANVAVALTGTGSYEATVTVSYNDAPAATALKSAATRNTVQLETLL